jgi:hypothetical protein
LIFQHTINQVLSGAKTQTSRIWKADYSALQDWNGRIGIVYSKRRKLYYFGQELSVQPARGKTGVARIRITELAKRDVRDFTQEDIEREGFRHRHEFFEVWVQMHDKPLWKWSQKFPELGFMSELRDKGEWHVKRNPKDYLALVIRFELLEEIKVA